MRECSAELPVSLSQLKREHATKVPGVKGTAVAFLDPLLKRVMAKVRNVSTLPHDVEGRQELEHLGELEELRSGME